MISNFFHIDSHKKLVALANVQRSIRKTRIENQTFSDLVLFLEVHVVDRNMLYFV
jgi:hypothetical protein